MKYIVTGSANLRFADGTSFSLTPGIHDDFPEEVKAHWAFSHHAEKITDDAAAVHFVGEEDLKAQLAALTETNAELTQQLAARDTELEDLKAQLAALNADKSGKTDKK
ncbi:hypothetical protein TUM17576_28250 [Enterobacter hormaechei]|nr:hypothetical protein [Enterobacter hormaechei]GJL36005.1 hypothetical protein TUM17576_28250 [Enterobacter hormaechei]